MFWDMLALKLQFASCLFMTGVIWIIQLIHYPCFEQIDRHRFLQFHQQHSNALGLIAGPMMTIELATALWLAHQGRSFYIMNAVLVLILWGLTFLVSVPQHHRLSSGFEEKAWLRLKNTNWLRTFVWTLRSIMLIGTVL